VLDFSKIEAGLITFRPQTVDLSGLMRGSLDLFTPEAAAKDIGLVFEGQDVDITVEIDPDRIRQVLLNLIDNALKYSAAHERVVVRAARDAGGVSIEVVDRGIGIPDSAIERIFAPFGRASNTGVVPGLGMGLYVAREIAERHGGRLSAVANAAGGGTTMCLWLPASLVLPAAATGGGEASRLEAPAPESSPPADRVPTAGTVGASPGGPAG